MCQRICLEMGGVVCVISGHMLCMDADGHNGFTAKPIRVKSAFDNHPIWLCRFCYRIKNDDTYVASQLETLFNDPPIYPPRVRYKKRQLTHGKDLIKITVQRIDGQ